MSAIVTQTHSRLTRLSALALSASAIAATLGATSAPARADDLMDAFTGGTPTLELRPRWEFVDKDGKAGAAAFTMRTLLGFSTKPVDDFGATLQFINVANIDGAYNDLVNGKVRYAPIPDPSDTNVNQAYVTFTGLPDTTITAGRQIINQDDVRFVGNVDFRQNMQTFDALTVTSKPVPDVKVTASYAWGIKDILNRHIPARIFLGEAGWAPIKQAQGEVFSYWYGNEADNLVAGAAACGLVGPQACNSVTYGLRAHGNVPLPASFSVDYKATYAHQSAYDGGSAKIDADYAQASAKLTWTDYFVNAEYMLMGSNGNGTYGFQTPLATKHAFNGWDEIFLTTPPAGLRTISAGGGATLYGATLSAKYYDFRSDYKDKSYGSEWDLSLTYALNSHVMGGVEYADYRAEGFGANTQSGWAFVKVTY